MASSFEIEWNSKDLMKRVQAVSEKNVINSLQRVRGKAFGFAPVDLGGYRESIEYRTWSNKGVFGGYVEAGEPGLEYLSFFLELGTPGDIYTGGGYKGRHRTPIEPQPHLRKALNLEKKNFVNSFRNAL